ncbi:Endoplasmic reticulum membrane protein 65 [Colletotrichum fructicola Nara gc5]|uniref:Endoplasmic reticulum membrane protein 65 n=1 Tax=Colletotrichum fructicola (strain Nara gc5) TaxID=1213859 RepID=A0A7J6JC76_COLFN|nr:Endoplasmic reticulum membrane protein 65 [Colletotrichum fructicola Nara gc5]
MAEGEHRVREAEDHASSGDTTAEPVEAFPAMPAFPSDGLPLDRNAVDTKSDIRVSHIPMPPLPSVSASAPPTSTLPTIPGGHSDEEQSSDASSTHSKPELQESSNSSSISEPATAVEKKDAEHKEGAEQKTRARAGSSSASMRKNQSHDNVRRLSVAGMQQLQDPEALPVAVVADGAASDGDRPAHISEQLQAIRQSILSQPDTLRRNGPVTDGGSRSRHHDEWRRPTSGRTLSTPPTNRRQSQSQTTSPRRNSFYTVARPPPLNLEAATHFNAISPLPPPTQTTSQPKLPQIQVPPPSSQQSKAPRNDPFPPSPLPPSIPLPPMSIPTHLQLELAAQRPSPLYIHHSHTNDIPYESYAVKWERLKNVLLLPSFLERTLYFGALACLDAWLYNFTILPMRFCIALGVLVKWWGYLAAKEARWMIGYVWHGLGRDGIKLYVIYNVLEVGDRLLSALGQDIFECLFSSETLSRNSSGRSKVLLPMGMFVLALVYNVIHSVSLYYQVITLNVAVNSYSNALLTLMISNQFVEIKSTVFKRFEKDNLFQLTCADIVERFQLWIMLLIIGMRNIVEVGGLSVPGAGSESGSDMGGGAMPLHSPSILPFSFTVLPSWVWSGEVLSPFLIVIGSEMLVDTIKHAYVNKFNNIKPTFYSRILDILCKDYYTNAFVTPSLTRRLGLAVIPLSCLFIRASVQTYHMFLSTRIPTPLPESTQTSLSVESATPSSPVMVAALDRLDTLLRDALGRAVYGYPYASPGVKARSWWSWTSDDVIAAVTMIVVFFIAFLVLLVIKLLLGMILLRYSRNRYAKMKRKEHLVATGQEERESYDAKGKRVGGYGHIEVTEDRRRWIHADEKEGLKGGKGRVQKAEKPPESDYNGVYRYEMVAKRIW